MINRRSLITGLASLIAAPAIVRFQNIMPVRRPPLLTSAPLYVGPGSITEAPPLGFWSIRQIGPGPAYELSADGKHITKLYDQSGNGFDVYSSELGGMTQIDAHQRRYWGF